MTNIRRHYIPNSSIFITSVCFQRNPFLKPLGYKTLLLEVMREVKDDQPYLTLGYAILDDHFHWLIRPDQDQSFSKIMQSVKLRFTRRYKKGIDVAQQKIWQPRFWDHVIRDEEDLKRHLDYIHFNPVKHGLVTRSIDYQWSSFNEYCKQGKYSPDWGVLHAPQNIRQMNLE